MERTPPPTPRNARDARGAEAPDISGTPATATASPQAARTALSRSERRLGLIATTIPLVVFALFAVIRIEGAVITSGAVAAEGNPRPVQSADGGVVQDVRVAEGDVVAAGDLLVQLDPAVIEVNQNILRNRLAELTARQLRLQAEAAGRQERPHTQEAAPLDPEIDPALFEAHLAGQIDIFDARRDVQAGMAAQLRERIAQYRVRTGSLEAQRAASAAKLRYLEEEIANLDDLNARGLAPESRLLELRGRHATERAQIETLKAEQAGNLTAIRDAELQLAQTRNAFQEEAISMLHEVEVTLGEIGLELRRLAVERGRLAIHAPVDGIVHELQVASAGEVLRAQDTVLTVVPTGEDVEFNFEVAPDAIDSVYFGQEARLRFTAFDQKNTPEIWGRVARISPDSVTDPATGRPFYRLAITVEEAELARLGTRVLVPGMPIEGLLQTGGRTILSYLVRPLTDQIIRTFRET